MGRKRIYTPEEAKARKAQAANERNKLKAQLNLKLWPSDKARWQAYARSIGFAEKDGFIAMLSACVERCILEDGWTWEPTPEDMEQIKIDAENRRS